MIISGEIFQDSDDVPSGPNSSRLELGLVYPGLGQEGGDLSLSQLHDPERSRRGGDIAKKNKNKNCTCDTKERE